MLAERLARRSGLVSNLRGLSFAVAFVGFLTALFGDSWVGTVVGVSSAAVFAFMVAWHARVLSAEDLAWRMWRVNENAARRARDDWHSLPETGADFQDPEHPYASDLDIFGPRSLFQFINVAHTSYGQAALARWLSFADALEEIQARQAAVRELAPRLELRQQLEAYTLRSPNPPAQRPSHGHAPLDLRALIAWAESEPLLLSQSALVWAARVLPLLTLSGFIATQLAGAPLAAWALPLGAQILLTLRTSRDASTVFAAVSSSPGAFSRLRPTLRLLENAGFDSPLLARLQAVLTAGPRSASAQMKRFESVLGWFELRHNGMVYPFINVLCMWDVHCVVALEKWQKESGRALRAWLESLGQWEALSSLAGLADDNPEFQFPELTSERAVFEAVDLGHPLIPARARVGNDVSLGGAGTAWLVTGSNMSGKSTLLRAMGLGVVLALAGTAVCARSLRVSPMRVYTSMRISDSLSAGVSHFYAELKKLRAALLATTGELPVFFLLDEILHGTNSQERQVGARWVLAQLLEANATGAVSTHDLALCTLPPQLMQRVRTVHLRETVEGERMSFDYRVRSGPVTGGNALLLMRSLGLGVPLIQGASRQPEVATPDA